MNANQRYEEKCNKVVIRIRKDKEPDLIEFLNNLQNRSEYIKQLIRNDMKLREVIK